MLDSIEYSDNDRKFYAKLVHDGERRDNLGITREFALEVAGKFYKPKTKSKANKKVNKWPVK